MIVFCEISEVSLNLCEVGAHGACKYRLVKELLILVLIRIFEMRHHGTFGGSL